MKKMFDNIDKKVYFVCFAIVIAMICCLIFMPDSIMAVINGIYNICIGQFGWLYIVISVVSFVLFFYLYFGKYGNIKFGKKEDKPKYSNFSWAAMIFTSGAGSSTIILGFAEPIYYLNTTPFHIKAMSTKAYEYAHMYGQYHWGISAWAFYIPAIVAVGYMLHVRMENSVRISHSLSPLFGQKRMHGILGTIIDILIVFGIIASITTSLGLAVPVLSKLLANVIGIEDCIQLHIAVFAIWFCIFGWSVFRGMDRGIKQLSNLNMYLIFGFLLIFMVLAPMNEIFNMELNSIGLYISQFPRMLFNTDPFGDKVFVNDWTLFYWGWWLSFLPIMGIFIAKISKGRTIKQVILGQMVWGSLGCCTFLGVLGGYSLYLQHTGRVDLVSILAKGGNQAVVEAIMQTFPFSKVLIMFLCILCFVFLATTIDSTAVVLGCCTSKKIGIDDDPSLFNRFSWAIAIFVLAIALTAVGGLSLVQKFAICLGFPLIFIVILLIISSIKAMKEDYGEYTAEEIKNGVEIKRENGEQHGKADGIKSGYTEISAARTADS